MTDEDKVEVDELAEEGDERWAAGDEHPDHGDDGPPVDYEDADESGDPIDEDDQEDIDDSVLPGWDADHGDPGTSGQRGLVRLTPAQQYGALRNLGWRIRWTSEASQAVRCFQQGYALGPALEVDGQVGPLTTAALLRSTARLKAGRGTASEHFSFTEFRCKCGGAFTNCRRIWQYRGSILSLEKLRNDHLHTSLRIISGCRCPGRNSQIPMAATRSQHMAGTAADIHISITQSRLDDYQLFAGIGYAKTGPPAGAVRHVDRRDLTGSANTVRNPMKWPYSTW